jgi:hypothetical protein
MFSNKRTIPLLVLFLLLLAYFLYKDTIHLLPSFIHAWTQSERYAIALRFLDNGFDLFHPATFNLQTVDGITRMDFPLNEFIVALIMKITGSTSPFIFRMYTLLISLTGLVFLYLLAKRVTASELKAWITVLFVFLSPLYTYYQAGFIPCVPSISFIFTAYYFFYDYKVTGNKKQFYISILFFLLAAMIRLPFLIFLLTAFLQQTYVFIKKRKYVGYELIAFITAFVLFGAYYRYNVHIGIIYGNMFLDTFLPAKNFEEFKEILQKVIDFWLLQYFTMAHFCLLILALSCTIFVLIKRREFQNKILSFNLLILGSGSLLYAVLMARQFYDHDYYFLDSLFVPVTLLFLLLVNKIPSSTFRERAVLFSCSAALAVFMFIGSQKNQAERYKFEPWDRVEMSRRNFMDADKYLDSIGIPADAKILVIDSYSTNIPLFLMKRKGFTVYQTSRDNAAFALYRYKWDYVVIQDQFLFSDVLKYYPVVSYVIEPLAGNGRITVYKRSKEFRKKSLSEMLGLERKEIVYSQINKDLGVVDSLTEYGLLLDASAGSLKKQDHLQGYVTCNMIYKENADLQIVASVTSGEQTLYYQSYKLSDYYKPHTKSRYAEFHFVLPDLGNDARLKIYFWNPGKGYLVYNNLKTTIYK